MKQLLNRLCGDQHKLEPIISVHQRIELVFKSTFADQNHAGFLGTYEFIDESTYRKKQNTILKFDAEQHVRACVCLVSVRACVCVCLACACMRTYVRVYVRRVRVSVLQSINS